MKIKYRRDHSKRAAMVVACLAIVFAGGVSASSNHIVDLASNIEICKVPSPKHPSTAFKITKSEPDENNDYWMTYECKETCSDWKECQVPSYTSRGRLIKEGKEPKMAVAFIVDRMGGHLSFTTRHSGNKTVLFHSGVGGTRYWAIPTVQGIENQSNAGTVMLRWDSGFIATSGARTAQWGWFTRTTQQAARIPNLNKRVASAIAWVHENLAKPGKFGTAGCSMGAQATFGAVYWHDIDEIVDYQLFIGGPPLWDINAGCGRRIYAQGYCDINASVACNNDSDCKQLADYSKCYVPATIPLARLYESFANHVHATTACNINEADSSSQPFKPFDESSFRFTEGDWDFDHPVDFHSDLRDPTWSGNIGSDEEWALGHWMQVFNKLESKSGHPKRWLTQLNASHCAAMNDGETAVRTILKGMELK